MVSLFLWITRKCRNYAEFNTNYCVVARSQSSIYIGICIRRQQWVLWRSRETKHQQQQRKRRMKILLWYLQNYNFFVSRFLRFHIKAETCAFAPFYAKLFRSYVACDFRAESKRADSTAIQLARSTRRQWNERLERLERNKKCYPKNVCECVCCLCVCFI